MAHIVELAPGDILLIRRNTPIDEGDGFIECCADLVQRLSLAGLLVLGPGEDVSVTDDEELASLGLQRMPTDIL